MGPTLYRNVFQIKVADLVRCEIHILSQAYLRSELFFFDKFRKFGFDFGVGVAQSSE
jgi:hypothetical protein